MNSILSDLMLSRRLERAEAHACAKFVEARAKVFPESGARWINVAGTYAMYDGVASPSTQTFGLGLFQEATSVELDAIEDFFKGRGAPVLHEVSPLAGLPLVNMLIDRNYRPVELSSVMWRPLKGMEQSAFPPNDRIRARPIQEDERELWAQVTAKGWSEYAEFRDRILEMSRVSAQVEDSYPFLAELDGHAIAAGGMIINSGVALLAGACTIPQWRLQGAQLALLYSRLRYAAELGCDIAMMGAEPGGGSQRNAERHGFRIAYTRTKWKLAEHTS